VLVSLPGIGRSTAAAIAAFAFGQRAAILDGNVKRVLCRHFGIEGFPGLSAVDRELWQLAGQLLPETGIEAYTQGLMDLGATLCTRNRPRCTACPLSADCVARREARQAQLPTAKPVRQIPERHASFVLITDGENLLLERRPDSGIWGGLLVPPEGEMETVISAYGLRLKSVRPLPGLKHSFTHFRLQMAPVLCHVEAQMQCGEPGSTCWLALDQAAEAGVPTPIRKLLRLLPEYL
jgi:A/G-specific adenine glycosylase